LKFVLANSQLFVCPECGQGAIEEVTEEFHPDEDEGSELAEADLLPRSPFLNLFFYQNELERMQQDPGTLATRRRTPRPSAEPARSRGRPPRMQIPISRGGPASSRSRSPHVSVLVEADNGSAVRIGINTGGQRTASANRFLSVAIDDIMDQFFAPGLGNRPPAMNDEQLQEIPKTTITEEQVQNELMCSVCFDDFQPNESEARKLPCDHIFHERCIFPWLKTNASCPVCRTKLENATPQMEHDDEEFGEFYHPADAKTKQVIII
jgi:hypothetical protein